MQIDNLEKKILRDNRRIKTLDVFFLLCDMPEVKDIETIGYNNNLVCFICFTLN